MDVVSVGGVDNGGLLESELDGVGLGILHLILNDIGDLLDAGDIPGSAAGAGNLVEGSEVYFLQLLVVGHWSTPSGGNLNTLAAYYLMSSSGYYTSVDVGGESIVSEILWIFLAGADRAYSVGA